jgi:tRNA threonylcarbamoyl adenosine modification protein YeaZ
MSGDRSLTGTVLAIDTATSRVVVARGGPDGALADAATWEAGYRHGEALLPSIERLLEPVGGRAAVRAIVVGTGPGAFTGLRVGIATAKGLAHGLACPIVGVPTGVALLVAAGTAAGPARTAEGMVLLLPAGPSDRVVVRLGEPATLLPGGTDPDVRPGEQLVAVDLDGRAPDGALEIGRAAHDGLAAALLRLGAERLARGQVDDLEGLVPDYVTLPRGVAAATGEVAWSRDPR